VVGAGHPSSDRHDVDRRAELRSARTSPRQRASLPGSTWARSTRAIGHGRRRHCCVANLVGEWSGADSAPLSRETTGWEAIALADRGGAVTSTHRADLRSSGSPREGRAPRWPMGTGYLRSRASIWTPRHVW